MWRAWSVVLVAAAVALAGVTTGLVRDARAESRASVVASPASTAVPAATPLPAPPSTPAPTPRPRRSTAALQQQVAALAAAADAQVAVSLVEIGGRGAVSWSYNGDQPMVAASTYKLPLLMDEAQMVAAGSVKPTDLLLYDDSEYEDGWYDDYESGEVFTRLALAQRAGLQSDNTAAHMLVAGLGGGAALNAYAAAHGASESRFFDPNLTTSSDLARLWANEASGAAGGTAAQQWLFPLLTHTSFEQGIPAGAPAGATVVHKIGELDGSVNDAALVLNAPRGSYVLTVMTDGPGGSAGWQLVASISRAVTAFEAAR